MKSAPLFLFLGITVAVSASNLSSRNKRQALNYVNKWPNNTMNYAMDKKYSHEFRAMFRDAFNYISSRTCVKFHYTEDKTKNVVDMQIAEDYCDSWMGMEGGWQTLNFAFPCAAFGVAVHEIMHALGIAHAQSRSDRDEYMVVESESHNDNVEETSNLVPWDYGSIMMYWRDKYRWPKDPEYNYTMGNLRVAFYDMILLNKFYECNCDGHRQLKCQNGGYQNPANCDECLCTDGFKGQLCNEMDGKVFEATTEWQHYALWYESVKGRDPNTMPAYDYIHITAPEGATIEVRIVKLTGFNCHETCDWNGVELKYLEDRRMTSPLLCCDNDNLWNKTRSSTHSPFVIVKYGEYRTPFFKFEYRYVPKK